MLARTSLALLCLLLLGAGWPALALAPSPAAERPSALEEALTRCLLTPEMLAKADWKPLIEACDPAGSIAEERCETCPCELVDGIVAVLRNNGFEVDFESLSTTEVTVALQLCTDVLLPAATEAGVELQWILDLAACETPSTCIAAFV